MNYSVGNIVSWLTGGKPKTSDVLESVELPENLPKHIAIIMDGNGRWAKSQGLPRFRGHQAGRDTIWEIVKACGEWGVDYLTLYAFSTENWGRPKEEVELLMSLLSETIDQEVANLNKNNVQLHFLGRIEQVPVALQKKMARAESQLAKNTGLKLQVMLSYGSRAEIVDAFRKLAVEVIQGKRNPADINEQDIQQALYTAGMPDPDLLIRTAGEYRLSNFLLWQVAYSEVWVTPVCWPDFHRDHLLQAIQEFAKRERRFGKVNR